jgi:hypothetical protein
MGWMHANTVNAHVKSTPQQMMGWIHRGSTAPGVIVLELVSRAQSRSEGKDEGNGSSARATVIYVYLRGGWALTTMKQLLKHKVDCNLLIQPKQYRHFCYFSLYHHGSIGSKSFQG